MKNNLKNIIVTIGFLAMITGFLLGSLAMADEEFSKTERSMLSQAPAFSFEKLLSGELFEEFDEYALDQFVFRDLFRALKAYGTYYLFGQKDNNNIYIVEGNIIKMEYRLNEKSVIHAAEKLNEIYRKYLEGKNVSFAVVPDKNYFTASEHGYLSLDYNRMLELLKKNVAHINSIDLFDSMEIGDYYKTDIHWSQDRIKDVADKLLEKMGSNARASAIAYTEKRLHPFYGSYYGQAAVKLNPDTLVYLTNTGIENAVVYDYETKAYSKVYMPDKFEGMDPYDVFLSGAKALLTISNPESTSDKELILFRDSFGSSIAPLLLSGYSKITLVDLRYISTDLLGSMIDFSKNQDVLFLYNTQILNNSYMLK